MNGQRAAEILGGLAAGQNAFTADEIEQLLAVDLAAEADPDDLAIARWIAPVLLEHAEVSLEAPEALSSVTAKLAEHDDKLGRDWYRLTTRDDKIEARVQARTLLRRARGYLADSVTREALVRLARDARERLLPNATYAPCPALGDEVYAITRRGASVRRELELRLARYGAAPLAAFLKAHDKAASKMQAFSGDITSLARGIGFVKKNPHQVVIGLAKSDAPPGQALRTYRDMMQLTNAPDAAVTCTRNATAFGGPQAAQQRLKQAQGALRQAGFPLDPVVLGAAKTLLPFEPLETGAARFRDIYRLVTDERMAHGELAIKVTARLMPADGTPEEVVERVRLVHSQLHRAAGRAELTTVVALASLARSAEAVPELVARFRELGAELARAGVCRPASADAHALECVACPGTPAEVAATVRQLIAQLTAGREPTGADVAIAAAFAKRFAY
ncbi:MAG TPA: hypothetical protein VNO30_08145 [Kofleriaceae bacterium]|nr:hypothetical protein [Kofleriaceae bacterium]